MNSLRRYVRYIYLDFSSYTWRFQVLGLLDRLSEAVSVSFFFQNIWLIMLTTPSARGTSLNFLARRLPHINAADGV